jgi:hypothetical protein
VFLPWAAISQQASSRRGEAKRIVETATSVPPPVGGDLVKFELQTATKADPPQRRPSTFILVSVMIRSSDHAQNA